MKKSLLLLLAAGTWVWAGAQNTTQTKRTLPIHRIKMGTPNNGPTVEATAATHANPQKATHRAAHRSQNIQAATQVPITTGPNLFGTLTAACTQVTANWDLNMIAFTHRESVSKTDGIGAYQTDYSLDGGTTWDTTTGAVVNKNESTRYPNGVIFNPMGNSNPQLAYVASAGPHTLGTIWDSNYASSIRFDGSFVNQMATIEAPNTTSATFYTFDPPHYMTSCDDSTVHFIDEAWSYNSALTATQGFYGAIVYTGTWNSTSHSFTWTTKTLRPHLVNTSDTSMHNDSSAALSQVTMAWSQDGATGYVVFFGDLDSANYAYDYVSLQPIVYKTTDHGATWNMMPMFNFATLPNLVQYIPATIDNPSVKLPMWDINGDSSIYYGHDVDATVDSSGNLHIFGAIEACALDNPDSAGYQYNPWASGGRYIYDVYTTTPTGGWQATFIDSLQCKLGTDASQTPWGTAPAGWGARIQASRTKGGSKVFCTWEDDINLDYSMLTADVVTAEIDTKTNTVTAGPTVVTSDGMNYFLQVSDIAFANGGCWNIPSVIVQDLNAPDNGTTSVNYIYLKDVCAGPMGVNNLQNTKFSVSQNFPNPFNGLTSFNVNLTDASTVSVDVFNMVGQKVWSKSAETMSSGTHMITINGATLSAGVYFYRVNVGTYSVTHKMVIE